MDDETPSNPSEVKEIERIAQEAMTPSMIEAEGYRAIISHPNTLRLHDAEDYRVHPRRVKRNLMCTDTQTLLDYWLKWKGEDSEIFADLEKRQVLMRFDEHTAELPQWGEHNALYECPQGKEWAEWEENDKNRMSQEEFGIFLEDRAKEVVEPNGTDLLALTQHFAVGQDVSYSKAQRQTDGNVQFSYSQTNAPADSIKIPETFTLGIAPFHNGKVYEVKARFRYRISNGSLAMWYELIEPWRVIEHAFDEVVAWVKEHTGRDVAMVWTSTL